MGRGAGSSRAILHAGLVRLGIGDELPQVAGRQILARHQHLRRLGDQRDRREVGRRIVERLLVERLIVGMGADAAERERDSRRAPRAPPGWSRSCRRRRSHPRRSPAGRRSSERRCARMRPMTSAPPPAANGTTMVTGRSGQSCAAAGARAPESATMSGGRKRQSPRLSGATGPARGKSANRRRNASRSCRPRYCAAGEIARRCGLLVENSSPDNLQDRVSNCAIIAAMEARSQGRRGKKRRGAGT